MAVFSVLKQMRMPVAHMQAQPIKALCTYYYFRTNFSAIDPAIDWKCNTINTFIASLHYTLLHECSAIYIDDG